MKKTILLSVALAAGYLSHSQSLSSKTTKPSINAKHLFMDVHDLEPGKVTFEDVKAAHQKDLATEGKYDVSFLKFWLDEQGGKVYCLSSARDTQSVKQTHSEAHGLLPATIFKVQEGPEASVMEGKEFFMDVHTLGAGNVTAAAVAETHKKDMAVQNKHGVNFINYWVDENTGTIFCLSQAANADAVIKTHKEAHGLLPAHIGHVKQGQ